MIFSDLLDKFTVELSPGQLEPESRFPIRRYKIHIPCYSTRIRWVINLPSYKWVMDMSRLEYGWGKLTFVKDQGRPWICGYW